MHGQATAGVEVAVEQLSDLLLEGSKSDESPADHRERRGASHRRRLRSGQSDLTVDILVQQVAERAGTSRVAGLRAKRS